MCKGMIFYKKNKNKNAFVGKNEDSHINNLNKGIVGIY